MLPLNFIFDTGAEHTILFDRYFNDLLGLPYDQKVKILGSDLSREMIARIVRNVPIKLNNELSVVRDIVVLEEDLMQLDEIIGVKLDGIIGGSFFNNLLVNIDFVKKKIVFYHPEKFNRQNLKGFTKVSFSKENHKPLIYCETNVVNSMSARLKLLLDTGASLPVLIHNNLDSSLTLPNNLVVGNLGIGLGGKVEGYVSRIDKLSIGTIPIKNPICFFQEIRTDSLSKKKLHREGILGTGILSRFEIFIDYLNQELYLKPNRSFRKPFKYDRSGLILYSFGPELNRFFIRSIIPNSPADLAGLKVGDEIKKIGLFKTKYFTLQKLTNKLSGRVGKNIRLIIEREDQKMKINFKLQELLKPIVRKP